MALDNLGSYFYPGTITFARPKEGTGGHADYWGHIVIDNSVNSIYLKGTLAHEMAHRGLMILNNYQSASPYKDKASIAFLRDELAKNEFESAMMQSLKNLHEEFVPWRVVPNELDQIIENIASVYSALNYDNQLMINSFLQMFQIALYKQENYHEEFVVRLPELIAMVGEIPPNIIDCFEPLAKFYKEKITPRMMSYIENHPYKRNLIPTDFDKYYPETYLSRSGEDELFAKAAANTLNKDEAKLFKQMEEVKILIKNKDTQSAVSLLNTFLDERVIRFTLKLAIEDNNQALFDATLSKIKAPQYLGPQLVLATEKNLNEVAKKLMLCVHNKYYLTKAFESSLKNDMPDIYNHIYDTTLRYNKWFIKKIEPELVAKTFVRNAEKLKENIDAPHANSQEILTNAPNQHISQQFSLNQAHDIPQAKANDLIAGNLSILPQHKELKQSTSILKEQPNTISSSAKPAVIFDSSVILPPPVLKSAASFNASRIFPPASNSAVSFNVDSLLPSNLVAAVNPNITVSADGAQQSVDANIALAAVAVGATALGAKAVYNYLYLPKTLSEKDKQWFSIVNKKDNIESIKEFLAKNKNFNLNTKDLEGKTALHLLANKNRKKTIEYLINTNKDLDINAQDKDGNTPLHFAVEKEYPQLVKLLISSNANTDIVNKAKHKAKDLAKSDFMQILFAAQSAIHKASNEISFNRYIGNYQRPKPLQR